MKTILLAAAALIATVGAAQAETCAGIKHRIDAYIMLIDMHVELGAGHTAKIDAALESGNKASARFFIEAVRQNAYGLLATVEKGDQILKDIKRLGGCNIPAAKLEVARKSNDDLRKAAKQGIAIKY